MSIFDRFKTKKETEPELTVEETAAVEAPIQETAEEPVPATEFVEYMLQAMNCEFKAEDRDNSIYYLFDYQGGHFRLDASKQSNIINIEFPFIYDVEPEYLNLVRIHCNDMNFRARFSKFLYTFDESKNRIFIHIFTGFNVPLQKNDVNGSFKAVLESHFALQRDFCSKLEEKMKGMDKNHPVDLQIENMQNARMMYLLNEQELLHQQMPINPRAQKDRSITVGDIINQFYTVKDPARFEEMRVVTDQLLILGDQEQIRDYPILSPLLEGEGESAKVKSDEVTFILKGKNESVTIQVTPKVEAEKSIYFRVNVMCPGLQPNVHAGRPMEVLSHSFVVAYDKTSEENHEAEFRYMWEDAKEKLAAKNLKDMTEEQRLICDLDKPNLAMEFYWGKKYFDEHRFCEALRHLEYIYREMNLHYQQLDKDMLDKFYNVCFLIGFCYNELRLYTQAFFYLDIVFQFHHYVETTEYVNCLVNSKDFRAIYVINGILDALPKPEDSSDEDEENSESTPKEDPNLVVFNNFLRRRKAYVLVDLKMWDEAEKLLQELLQEPANADFALSELAYLQKQKG